DKDGRWEVRLGPFEAGGPHTLKISGPQAVTIQDVLVGDVWLCAGQSNMEWGMTGSDTGDDIPKADLPKIRQTRPGGNWVVCTPESAAGFKAVGFYFARAVQRETGVPIGLVNNAVGGSRIEPWVDPASVASATEVRPALEGGKSGLFIAKTLPLVPYGLRGMLWYQGESNGSEGTSYLQKLQILIGGWRKLWGQGDFPLYVVQLPNFQKVNDNPAGGDGWANIREAQLKALAIPNTGVIITIDVGEPKNIHPKNKFDVGERLARWALAKDYGKKDLVYSGPLYKGMKVEGNKVRIAFDHVGSGLMVGKKEGRRPTGEVKDGRLKRFAVAGADKKWVWADAVIEKDTVVVSSPDVPNPVAVRYAFSGNPEGCNLYNKEGLPASPFRTDDWE
ncbi:MAG TPA: sialate O-acetylesterase, partial [Phycisphaerae bacterium]|nr:sialate O-acetylesterase [Phycisphaerae bacterium]